MPTVKITGAPTVAPVKLVLLAMAKHARVNCGEHTNKTTSEFSGGNKHQCLAFRVLCFVLDRYQCWNELFPDDINLIVCVSLHRY